MFADRRSKWLVAGCVALLGLTLLAGGLQYHWINRVSDADRRQRQEYLAGTLRNFGDDFRETILRLVPFFRARSPGRDSEPLEKSFLDLTRQWRSGADRPQLLRSVSIGTQNDPGDQQIVFRRLRLEDDQFREESWPTEFSLYRTILEKRLRLPGGEPPFFPRAFAFEFVQGRPVLIFPLVTGGQPFSEGQPRPGSFRQQSPRPNSDTPRARGPLMQPPGPGELLQALRPATAPGSIHTPELQGWCFLEINSDYLREHLLPELVARHYGPEARSEYQVAIVANQPLSLIYTSEPQLKIDSQSQVDGGIVLLEANMMQGRYGPPPGPFPDDRQSPQNNRVGPPPPPPPGPQPLVFGPTGRTITDMAPPGRGGNEESAWLLVVKNKGGSLESLVEHSRRHNLAVSFGILLLLAGSTMMLIVATARARSLARQQLEFVAGVSHELRTPLTVIHSTSYNLSKGLVHDPTRVQQYGAVIQNEARRLINQVERMLSFAGIQAGRRAYDPQPTNVAEIIERALAEYADALANEGWQVEQHRDARLPLVLTDAAALESSLKNLFENALKYASPGKWLSVRAAVAQARRGFEVQITIADHGHGISAKDQAHIFEPFYRGHEVMATSNSGAGLGLSIVDRQMRALGGRVTVRSSTAGAAFTLHLPAISAESDPGINRLRIDEQQHSAD